MPSRVPPETTHDDDGPARPDTPPSDSETSFVSATSDNQNLPTVPQRHIVVAQTTTPQSTNILSRPPLSHLGSDKVSDTSSLSSNVQEPTPLPRKQRASSPESKELAQPTSYFGLQVDGASGLEPRSPFNKRAPASRSSHGIETRTGPPPALSTNRSYTGEAPWRLPSGKRLPSQATKVKNNGFSEPKLISSEPGLENSSSHSDKSPTATNDRLNKDASKRFSASAMEDDQDSTLRGIGRDTRVIHSSDGPPRDREDLFLDMANADTDEGSDTASRVERRRSRTGHPGSISSRPGAVGQRFFGPRASPHQTRISPQKSSVDRLPATASSLSSRNGSLRERPYAASAHPLEQRHLLQKQASNRRPYYSSPQQDIGEPPMTSGRRGSINSSFSLYNSSPLNERPGSSRVAAGVGEGTESTVSTTAPSTVWDELDDLKSRIRKIELTGNLPSSSSAAMSTVYGERPATANTTLTDISSSPKRRQRASASPEAATIPENTSGEVHPLLQSALAKAGSVVGPQLYRALEATATDALALAHITQNRTPAASSAAHASASAIDRQLRRKAENMCRSLTELCITLGESNDRANGASPPRPRSNGLDRVRDAPNNHASPSLLTDPEMKASSRIMSRVEARRSSLQASSSFGQQEQRSSPQPELPTPTQERPPLLNRTSSVIRYRGDIDEQSNSNRRPLSRAATQAGFHRPSPQTRHSREYTSQHPMPTADYRSPSVTPSVSARKSYFPPTNLKGSTTPKVEPANSRYLDRSTPPSTDSDRLAEARQRRIASLGRDPLTREGASGTGLFSRRAIQVEPHQ